jgi:4-amino-4-deoxy-L-arabinose transferase-like glycosyltransferase
MRIGVPARPGTMRILFMITFGAVALRLAAVKLRGDMLTLDESMYIMIGRNLLSGHGYTLCDLPNVTFPFLIPVLAGIVDHFAGPKWAVSLPSAFLGGVAVFPLFFLAEKMASRTVAFASAILYAGFPALLYFYPDKIWARQLYGGSEPAFLFFVLSAACFAWRAADEGRWRDYIVGGLFAGAAFEARQDGAANAAVIVAWLVGVAIVRRQWQRIPRAAAFALCALVVAAPFVLYAREVTGVWGAGPRFAKTFQMRDTFMPVIEHNDWRSANASYGALNADGTQLETSFFGVSPWHRQRLEAGGESVSLAEALSGLRPAYFMETLRVFINEMVPGRLGYAALLGMVALLLAPKRFFNLSFLVVQLVPAALIAMLLFPLARFWMCLAPFLVMLTAWGIIFAFELIGMAVPKASRWITVSALSVVTAISVYGAYSSLSQQAETRAAERGWRVDEGLYKEVAQWLFVNTPTDAVVISPTPQPALMADRRWLVLPGGSPERVLAYAQARHADILMRKPSDETASVPVLEPGLLAILSREGYGKRVSYMIYDLHKLYGAPAPKNASQ